MQKYGSDGDIAAVSWREAIYGSLCFLVKVSKKGKIRQECKTTVAAKRPHHQSINGQLPTKVIYRNAV